MIPGSKKYEICTPAKLIVRRMFTKSFKNKKISEIKWHCSKPICLPYGHSVLLELRGDIQSLKNVNLWGQFSIQGTLESLEWYQKVNFSLQFLNFLGLQKWLALWESNYISHGTFKKKAYATQSMKGDIRYLQKKILIFFSCRIYSYP